MTKKQRVPKPREDKQPEKSAGPLAAEFESEAEYLAYMRRKRPRKTYSNFVGSGGMRGGRMSAFDK